MGKITFSGALPADPNNGLGIFSDEFLKNPRELRLVVGLVSSQKTVENHENGLHYPVIRIQHMELVLPGKDTEQAAQLLANAFGSRTGAVELPLQWGDDAPMKEAPFPEETAPDDEEAGE